MEENKLPIKTKIAAIWTMLIGIIILVLLVFVSFVLFMSNMSEFGSFGISANNILLFLIPFSLGLSTVFCSLKIIKKRKLAWWLGIILIILLACILSLLFFRWKTPLKIIIINFIIFLIPLIILFFDRKKFFEIAK